MLEFIIAFATGVLAGLIILMLLTICCLAAAGFLEGVFWVWGKVTGRRVSLFD